MSSKNSVALTSTGRVRHHNEDSFGYRSECGIFVVCDGMGGAAGGEVASRLAVDTVLSRVCVEAPGTADRNTLHEAIAEANRAVLRRAEQDADLSGMGTTLVALLLRSGGSGSALIAHAGDSRCYLFRQGLLSRRTHDHSLVDEQLRLGAMTQEEADRSPFRSVITRAVGTQPSVTEEITEMDAQAGDVFLLCTDGLTREVPEDCIQKILAAEAELLPAAQRLIDAANAAGGRDNITCMLVRIP